MPTQETRIADLESRLAKIEARLEAVEDVPEGEAKECLFHGAEWIERLSAWANQNRFMAFLATIVLATLFARLVG